MGTMRGWITWDRVGQIVACDALSGDDVILNYNDDGAGLLNDDGIMYLDIDGVRYEIKVNVIPLKMLMLNANVFMLVSRDIYNRLELDAASVIQVARDYH